MTGIGESKNTQITKVNLANYKAHVKFFLIK